MSETAAGVNSSLNSVSGALDLVASAAREGAADAQEAASKALAGTSLFFSRVIYQTTYSVSYGVVFPVAFVARAIPRDNAAVRGLIEGAQAATLPHEAVMGRAGKQWPHVDIACPAPNLSHFEWTLRKRSRICFSGEHSADDPMGTAPGLRGRSPGSSF